MKIFHWKNSWFFTKTSPQKSELGLIRLYWAALSLSFRLISIVNEHNSLGSPGKHYLLPIILCWRNYWQLNNACLFYILGWYEVGGMNYYTFCLRMRYENKAYKDDVQRKFLNSVWKAARHNNFWLKSLVVVYGEKVVSRWIKLKTCHVVCFKQNE